MLRRYPHAKQVCLAYADFLLNVRNDPDLAKVRPDASSRAAAAGVLAPVHLHQHTPTNLCGACVTDRCINGEARLTTTRVTATMQRR